jgi:tRNA1(Val) A37 N6-methylase TrmN6
METIHELLGYEKIKIVQNGEMFCFSMDSMLLADFVRPKPSVKMIVDLGCGNAPIPLFLTLKTKAKIIGVELQEEVFKLAVRSVELNHFEDQISLVQGNIKDIHQTIGANRFDIVTSNPPYFRYLPSSNLNKNEYLTIARHEVEITLEEIIHEANRLLTDGGVLYMVHRCERLAEVVNLLEKYHFGLKTIRFIYPKTSSVQALLFLLAAKSNRKHDTVIEKPLYVYGDGNQYTDEVRAIFNFPNKHLKK